LFGLVLIISVLACELVSAPAAPSDNQNVATVVASTIQALTPAAPLATATLEAQAPQGIPVNYKNVTFTIPTGLATDAAPVIVPQASGDAISPWDASPEHIEFRLNNYNIPADAFSTREIRLYPARQYADVHSAANITLQRLQSLLGNPSASPSTDSLPHVPFFNADAMISAQVQRVHFQNGDGVRMVTQYGQAVMPIANSSTFYQFIGLTSDGKYLIVAVLPIHAPVLANAEDPSGPLPAGGVPFPSMDSTDAQVFETYFQAVTEKLNATDSAAFQPSLATLDALMQSFSVQP